MITLPVRILLTISSVTTIGVRARDWEDSAPTATHSFLIV